MAIAFRGCASVIVSHSHPSQDPTPSAEDEVLTRRLIEAGQLLGIPDRSHRPRELRRSRCALAIGDACPARLQTALQWWVVLMATKAESLWPATARSAFGQ